MNSTKDKIKVLYIQVPPGGGSLIALYEMLKNLPSYIDPVVICYYRNQYCFMLETVCKVIYLDIKDQKIQEYKTYSSIKVWGLLQLQYRLLKDYLFNSNREINAVYRIIQQEQPGIIHHNNEIFLNRDAIRAGIKAKAVQVVHERSLGNYGYNYVNRVADTFLMRKVAARIDITKAVADHFDTIYGTAAANIILHDMVDTQKYQPAKADDHVRVSLGISEQEKVITCIGRIISWKGQHVLIEAIHLLKDKLGAYKLLVAGPDEEGIGSTAYKTALQQMVVQYGLSDHIIFTGNRDDIPALINISDVIVHCSVKPEPQGLVIIEALLCKKPVIASGNGGSGELIRTYGGIALETTDAATLAAALENILIQEHIPETNYAQLLHDFDAVQQVSVLTALYKKVLQNKDAVAA